MRKPLQLLFMKMPLQLILHSSPLWLIELGFVYFWQSEWKIQRSLLYIGGIDHTDSLEVSKLADRFGQKNCSSIVTNNINFAAYSWVEKSLVHCEHQYQLFAVSVRLRL